MKEEPLKDLLVGPHLALREVWSPDDKSGTIDYRLVETWTKIRDKVGGPIIVTSGYRTRKQNSHVRGARASYHLTGLAMDLSCPASCDFETFSDICTQANLAGGILLHPEKRYVHVDRRDLIGRQSYFAVIRNQGSLI